MGQSDLISYSFDNPFAIKTPACDIPVILSSIQTPLSLLSSCAQISAPLGTQERSDSDCLRPWAPCALMSNLQSSATTTQPPPSHTNTPAPSTTINFRKQREKGIHIDDALSPLRRLFKNIRRSAQGLDTAQNHKNITDHIYTNSSLCLFISVT